MGVPETAPFGRLLRRYRRAAGLTQEALAERALLSTFTISALERGTHQAPRKDTLALLAEALALAPPERAALEAAAQGRGAVAASPAAASRPLAPLVGRAREIALLDRHLAGDGPPVLLFAGTPGIGKSRLLAETARRARVAGWAVLAGGCQQSGGQDPYAPLPAALEGRLRHATAAQVRAALEGCAWLVRVLPEVAEVGSESLPAWTVSPSQERRLVVRALERYLRNVAGPAGTLLLLDDLQWAGPDSLAMLTALLQRAEEIPLRLVAAYRSNEVAPGAPLSNLVADLLRTGRAALGTLAPLTPDDAGSLLDALLAGRAAAGAAPAEVLRRAGGLPYFLVSCAEGLAAGEPAARVPETVTQSIRQRVAALSAAAQALVRAAAVAGRVTERSLLLATVGQPRGEGLEALDAACRAHLLEEAGSAAYRFTHDLVREVVEGDLSAARRALLHQRLAEALESGAGAPTAEMLAYHYMHSDAAEKAVYYLERAGGHARAMGAAGAAEAYYRELVGRLEALGRRSEAARAHAWLGLHMRYAWRHADAMAAFRRCFDAYLAGAADERRLSQAQALLALIDEREPETARGVLYLAYATVLGQMNLFEELLTVTERAADLLRHLGDIGLLIQVLIVRGEAFVQLGRPREHRDVLQEACRLCEANGYLGQLVEVLQDLEIVAGRGGEPDQMRVYSVRSLEVAEQIGDPLLVATATFGHMWYAFYTGDWARAQADLRRAAQLAPQFAHNESFLCNQGQLLMAQGAWAEAAACLEAAFEASLRAGGTGGWPRRLLAELDLVQERPASALARLQPLLGHEHIGAFGGVVYVLPLVAWAQVQLGHFEEALAPAAQAVARAIAEPNYRILPDALRIQALAAMGLQRWAEAERCLAQGLAEARRTRYPHAEAHVLRTIGQLHWRTGEQALARSRLEAALALFRRLGARKDVERTEQLLTSFD